MGSLAAFCWICLPFKILLIICVIMNTEHPGFQPQQCLSQSNKQRAGRQGGREEGREAGRGAIIVTGWEVGRTTGSDAERVEHQKKLSYDADRVQGVKCTEVDLNETRRGGQTESETTEENDERINTRGAQNVMENDCMLSLEHLPSENSQIGTRSLHPSLYSNPPNTGNLLKG